MDPLDILTSLWNVQRSWLDRSEETNERVEIVVFRVCMQRYGSAYKSVIAINANENYALAA